MRNLVTVWIKEKILLYARRPFLHTALAVPGQQVTSSGSNDSLSFILENASLGLSWDPESDHISLRDHMIDSF
jgi:hypothetical protein